MGVGCSNKQTNQFTTSQLPYVIQITAYIWCENGHNLFDYESESLVKKQIEFDFQGIWRLVQVDKDIVALSKNVYSFQQKECVRNQRELFELKCSPKSIEVSSQIPENQFWKVIRPIQASDLPTIEKQKLQLNSLIKLGRVKLTVLDYGFAYEFQDVPDEMESKLNDSDMIDGTLSCRVCFSKLATMDNPFICPCKCTGSIRYIHLKCLQNWINSMMKKKSQNGVTLYYWKTMKCELCKTQYKSTFKFKQLVYNICDIEKPKEPYLILQINHCDKNKEQGLYVIDIKQRDQIKIGRTQDCDIKMHDISVSRHHASIFINHQEQSFYLEDNCSKFGTLVNANQDDLTLLLQAQRKLALQIGRAVLIIQVEKKNNNKKQLNKANRNYKYRVPAQFEVFRTIKYKDDEELIQQSIEVEDIIINDPNFDKDLQVRNNINFLTGSIIQRDN